MIETYRKIFSLLDAREQRRAMLLVLMVMAMGIMEAVGVASILPFLVVLADPGIIARSEALSWLQTITGLTETHDFLMFLGFGAFAVVVVGLAVKATTLYAMTRFTTMRNHTLAVRMLGVYLAHPYTWFLGRHSAGIAKTVLGEVSQVVNGAIVPSLRLLAQLSVVAAILILLVAIDPIMALTAGAIVGGLFTLLTLLTRNRIKRLGVERARAQAARFRSASEVLGGIKEVKLLGLERSYLEAFREPSERMSRVNATQQLIAQMPRHVMEAILFGGMLVMVLVMLARDASSLTDMLPILGLYAFAGARLFPAIQNIYAALNAMRFNTAVLDNLLQDLAESRRRMPPIRYAGPPLPFEHSFELEDVRYRYPNAEGWALDGLSISFPARAKVGVVGGTGAGKTTAVDVVLGLLTPDSGAMCIDGVEVDSRNLAAWRASIGYVPQQIYLIDDTVAVNIAFGVPRDRIDMAAVERAARMAELHGFVIEELPEGYQTKVGERGVRLSGGQRQRIGIARALYHDPQFLVFDEATSALDNVTERAVMDAVENLAGRKTILMIAHRLSTIRDCDVIFLLRQGRVVASGAYDDLLERSPEFRALAQDPALEVTA